MSGTRVRYATTADGINIAYTSVGNGPPVFHARRILNPSIDLGVHLLERQYPEMLARRSVVIWDWRNFGLSDTGSVPTDIEPFLLDMQAVIDDASTSPVDTLGILGGCQVVLAHAARYAAHVRKIALVNPWSGSTFHAETDGFAALRRADFAAFADLTALRQFGWDQAEEARRWAESLKRSYTAESYEQFMEIIEKVDARALASQVTVSTLVVISRSFGAEFPGAVRGASIVQREGRALAAAIPQAELVMAEDAEIPAPLTAFFAADAGAASAGRDAPRGTAVILFADIVDSTALTERLGDAAFREKARALDDALRSIITGAGGTPIDGKLLGDGVLATFPAASQAIDAALRCGAAGDEQGLPLHLGLHAGDVIREANNVFGGAVNIASRVSGLSAPGEVLVSATVRELARTSAGVTFEDRGEHALKGRSGRGARVRGAALLTD